jgi:hypothetical protein
MKESKKRLEQWSVGVLEYWKKTESGRQNKEPENGIRKFEQIESVIAA